MSGAVHVFGVRHLSPAGSWHLLQLLDEVKPSAVLIEGPSDATSQMKHLVNSSTRPPVAILAYTETLPVQTVLWPLAVYSPELQAMKWAEQHGAESAFIDLPSAAVLALRDATSGARSSQSPVQTEGEEVEARSIYERIADLAGESDYDMYWESRFEHNLEPDAYRLQIDGFSAQLRELTEGEERAQQAHAYAYNHVREAYMKRRINEYIAAGHDPSRIVVVCGAYHAATLRQREGAMTADELAALPHLQASMTLMPYSYFRLSSMSGYGAGNVAPAYYECMWQHMQAGTLSDLSHDYLGRIVRQLRASGTHRSTAEVIEAVRLADALAALRGAVIPTLAHLHDAAQTLLGHGDLSVVASSLAHCDVGTAIGELADGVSQTPVQEDMLRQLKRLKLEKHRAATASELQLDLRENRRVKSEEAAFLDLNRSTLLHRLTLLEIPFARQQAVKQDQATWSENWTLQWTPEAEIRVVETTLLGETIELAAAHVLMERLKGCDQIADAAQLISDACRCALSSQLEQARSRLQELAADSRDVVQLAAAARSLSLIVQYGDVRRIATEPLLPLLQELFVRAALYVVDAAGCSHEAARELAAAIGSLQAIASDHSDLVDEQLWLDHLRELALRDDRHSLLSGLACAILLEKGVLSAEDCEHEVSRRLSPGAPADLGAGWFEGLAMRNRYALLSRMGLWEQLDAYIATLDDEAFRRALVFLRRSFSSFAPREKVMVAEVLGELWGVSTEQAAEVLSGDLVEKEAKIIEELDEFDFEDF